MKNPNDLMILDLTYLGQMTNLTELRLKGLSGIKLSTLPSFENLINLKTLVSSIHRNSDNNFFLSNPNIKYAFGMSNFMMLALMLD